MSADPRLQRAVQLHQQGHASEAIPLYRAALTETPKSFDAAHMLGVALCQTGALSEGIDLLRRAVALKAHSAAELSLAQALFQAQDFAAALPHFQAAPFSDTALLGAARCLNRLRRPAEVIDLLENRTISALLLNERGKAQSMCGRFALAAADHTSALAADPHFTDARYNLGRAQAELGVLDSAEANLRQVIAEAPNHRAGQLALANVYRQLSRITDAEALARSVLEAAPGNAAAKIMLAMCLIDQGMVEEPEQLLRQALNSAPHAVDALAALVQLRTLKPDDPAVAVLDLLLSRNDLSASERQSLLYSKAKVVDDHGDAKSAVSLATLAKAALPMEDQFGPYAEFTRGVQRLMDASFFAARREGGNDSVQPVFVIGMPRSGTSLVEQIISAHPDARGAGELQAMPRLASELAGAASSPAAFMRIADEMSPAKRRQLAEVYLSELRRQGADALRITDKLPHNFQNLWLIALLFPKSRIIHCERHPADVCISIYLKAFSRGHWYTQSLPLLGKYYRLYEETVARWKAVTGLQWHSIRYEDLVTSPRTVTPALIDFLGLPWNDACLDPSSVKRAVSTFSSAQVRQPIYKSSVERWRKYAPYIKPLLDELGIEA